MYLEPWWLSVQVTRVRPSGHKGERMSITVSIEIYQDDDDLFRWVLLDSKGQKHGPSIGYESRSVAHASIEEALIRVIEV